MLQCSLCDAPMMNLANPCSICFFLILALCSGCVRGLFPLGGTGAEAQPPAPVSQTVQALSTPQVTSPVAANPERKRKVYEPDAGSDFAYQNAALTEDVTWSGKVSVRGVLTIAPQTTLAISPGTVVTFQPDDAGSTDGALLVLGRLCAKGTSERPVLFRPGTRTAEPGDWQGILLLGSEKKNLLEQCRVEGAATGLEALFSTITLKDAQFLACETGVRLKGALLAAAGGGASNCGLGYALVESESDIRDAVFSGNTRGLFLSGGALRLASTNFAANAEAALEAKGARLSVLRSAFAGNGSGLVLTSTEGEITSSKLVANRGVGVRLTGSRMRLSGNVISRNTDVGIMADDAEAAAWGNDISSNGRYDLYNAGREDFMAPGNWWGTPSLPEARIRIYDREDDPRNGSVRIEPRLAASPVTP